MPMRAFWFVSGMVERIRCDEGRLALEISAAQGEGAAALHKQLSEAHQEPVKLSDVAIAERMMNAPRDEMASSRLKALAG